MSNLAPDHIRVRGAKVHNLRDIDADIPLNSLVGIAGVKLGKVVVGSGCAVYRRLSALY